MSAESEVLHAVIEDDVTAAEIMLMDFSVVELTVFSAQLATLRHLIRRETERRVDMANRAADTGTVDGIRPHRPMSQEGADLQRRVYEDMLADTGEINIVRGRE